MGLLLAALQEAKLLPGVHVPVGPQVRKVWRRSSSSGERSNQNQEDEVEAVEDDADAGSIHKKQPVGHAGSFAQNQVVMEDRPVRERTESPHEKLTNEER